MIKCSDLLISVLGYRKCNDASWFRTMLTNERLIMQVGESTTDRYFSERGIYTALMKSNKPIAEQF